MNREEEMEEVYTPKTLEPTIQAHWEKNQAFKVKEDLNKQKFYCLAQFPYPSGKLHMGHVRVYTLSDAIARYQRMLGKNVLHPMGWDAFGLPAENAAIEHGVAPAEWTEKNIAHMKGQLNSLGLGYDWSREVTTCDPEYYRWEQAFFLKLYEKGLAYRKKSVVNWDPVDQTVLANEQVIDGKGWRSGSPIERRKIRQWFLKITAYAEELLNDLEKLTEWPEPVLTMQRNWIGRSQGLQIDFSMASSEESISVFTTRPDTLFGTTYLTLASEHPVALQVAEYHPDIKKFIESCRKIQVSEAAVATLEKQGVDTTLKAIHPLTGEKIPIWIANFVLMEYGTGAVMSVPGHDQRDYEFAKQYGLAIQQVIKPIGDSECDLDKEAFTEKGLLINSDTFNGLNFTQAFTAIADHLVKQGKASKKVHYRLRDWGVSRQRYWGTPIPIIYCKECGTVPVPESDLPVVLPQKVQVFSKSGQLAECDDFYHTTCPKCQRPAHRETDTFDTFMESSWYYARYACRDLNQSMVDDRVKYWNAC